jgi:hypothetical protein
MRIRIQSWLMACCILLLGGASALAQPADCDPASLPNTPGSCQFPNTTFPNGGPGCYTCVPAPAAGQTFICVPDDSFCDAISGGDETNDCRVAECLDVTGTDPANPSGCDYTLDTDADENCVLCISPDPVPFDHCGNGICEPLEGETCDNCGVDCNPAGYDAACLNEAEADAICVAVAPPVQLVIFSGPPYPTTGQGPGDECEDGDLCTDNVCATFGDCAITDKVCEPDADFCCPSGCDAPTGTSCLGAAGPIPGCDPDCYVPVECAEPIPTPTPTPPPPANPLLEGSGCSLSAMTGSSSALAWLAGLGLIGGFGFLRRRR